MDSLISSSLLSSLHLSPSYHLTELTSRHLQAVFIAFYIFLGKNIITFLRIFSHLSTLIILLKRTRRTYVDLLEKLVCVLLARICKLVENVFEFDFKHMFEQMNTMPKRLVISWNHIVFINTTSYSHESIFIYFLVTNTLLNSWKKCWIARIRN